MMDFEFIDEKNNTHSFHVSEKIYEQLFYLGINKVAKEEQRKIEIDNELYEVDAIHLSNDNRYKIIKFLTRLIFEKIEELYVKRNDIQSHTDSIRFDINFLYTTRQLIKEISDKKNEWFQLNP